MNENIYQGTPQDLASLTLRVAELEKVIFPPFARYDHQAQLLAALTASLYPTGVPGCGCANCAAGNPTKPTA